MERWQAGVPRVVSQEVSNSLLVQKEESSVRILALGEKGEILVAVEGDRLRLSMERANGTFCVFEFPREKLEGFLGLEKYSLKTLREAIYEDPIVSGLTREEAHRILGLEKICEAKAVVIGKYYDDRFLEHQTKCDACGYEKDSKGASLPPYISEDSAFDLVEFRSRHPEGKYTVERDCSGNTCIATVTPGTLCPGGRPFAENILIIGLPVENPLTTQE